MTIKATIVADSVSPTGKRITTFSLEYPRFFHSQIMTHRQASRNASSSRAIPVAKMIERVMTDPAIPSHWGVNVPGMQSREELGQTSRALCEAYWLKARDTAVEMVKAMCAVGLHKEIANRALEPWSHINVVMTATEWSNFFALRDDEAAQPEIQILARAMKDAMANNVPKNLDYGQWHLPYVDPTEGLSQQDALKVSTARCARVSYLNHEGKRPEISKDLELYERLMGGKKKHASSAEHQATPIRPSLFSDYDPLRGNFVGWQQYRKMVPGEYIP